MEVTSGYNYLLKFFKKKVDTFRKSAGILKKFRGKIGKSKPCWVRFLVIFKKKT